MIRKLQILIQLSKYFSYWDQKYTLRQQHIPGFLEKIAEKILMTGKYLNVIRECGQNVKCPFAEKLFYTALQREYVEKINKAYTFSSEKLLELILEKGKLMDRLRFDSNTLSC
jgi:gamma-tubulin complex component 2